MLSSSQDVCTYISQKEVVVVGTTNRIDMRCPMFVSQCRHISLETFTSTRLEWRNNFTHNTFRMSVYSSTSSTILFFFVQKAGFSLLYLSLLQYISLLHYFSLQHYTLHLMSLFDLLIFDNTASHESTLLRYTFKDTNFKQPLYTFSYFIFFSFFLLNTLY